MISYTRTKVSCYIGYVVQAIVNNLLPLFFLILQTDYDLTYEALGRLILINFCVQIAVDIVAVKAVNIIGYRTTVVLSSTVKDSEGVISARNIEELKNILSNYNSDEIMICGGEQIYRLLVPYCDEAYVTKIKKTVPANKFFPDLDSDSKWILKETSDTFEHNGIEFTFNTYKNKGV